MIKRDYFIFGPIFSNIWSAALTPTQMEGNPNNIELVNSLQAEMESLRERINVVNSVAAFLSYPIRSLLNFNVNKQIVELIFFFVDFWNHSN